MAALSSSMKTGAGPSCLEAGTRPSHGGAEVPHCLIFSISSPGSHAYVYIGNQISARKT
jgi:hypothetical protein